MFPPHLFDSKTVHYQFELHWEPFMFPYPWKYFALVVATFVESFSEEFVG